MADDLYEVVSVTNISEYDFPAFDNEAQRQEYRVRRSAHYAKPSVPVLMYDGKIYALKAGETKSFPRFLADHFTKLIIDREIMTHKGDVKSLNDKNLREQLKDKIQGKIAEQPVVKEVEETQPEASVAELETLGMGPLRKIAKEKGVKVAVTMGKQDLIDAINGKA